MKKSLPIVLGIILCANLFSYSQNCVPLVDSTTGRVVGSGGNNYADSTIITWNHPVSGTNRLLIVQVAGDVYSDSVKYAGIKLTRLDTTGNGSYKAEMWYLLNPPAGKNSVTVNFPPKSGTFYPAKSAQAISFTQVDQATPFGTAAKDTGSSCPTKLLVSSGTNQLIVDMIVKDYFKAVNPGTSQTKLYAITYFNTNAVGGSVKSGTAATDSMQWSWQFCQAFQWAALGVSIHPNCVTASAEIKTENSFSIYPNPASSAIFISSDNNILEMQITDLTGRIIYSEKTKSNTGKISADISFLPAGMYMLKIVDSERKTQTQKFIRK